MQRPAHVNKQRKLMMSDPHDREPVDQATIDCWRTNYGLDKRTPGDAARYWADTCAGMAPAGAVAALGVALDDMESLRKDAERYRWLRNEAGDEAAELDRSIDSARLLVLHNG